MCDPLNDHHTNNTGTTDYAEVQYNDRLFPEVTSATGDSRMAD